MNLIFINGTMGAGKTTVSRALKNKLAPCAFADGDNLWEMSPFLVNEKTKAMVLHNIAAVLAGFLDSGVFENVLFCWVMHEESIVKEILSRLNGRAFDFSLFTLQCDHKTLEARLQKDIGQNVRTQGVLARSAERASHYGAMLSAKIDVSRLTPEAAAEKIADAVTGKALCLPYRATDFLSADARAVREEVFVREQGFKEEFDGKDAFSQHLVFYKDGRPAACCRIFPAEGERAGVAEVKALLEDCYVKPVECDRKLFVLDRVHEMLAPAQNKLLKVLEEPPANVYFLLGAASEFPVLPTVRSRARRLELFAFPEEEIAAHIRRKYPHRADAREIAALSGGALGRAEELAEGGSLAGAGEEAARFLLTLSPAGIPAAVRRYSAGEDLGRFLPLLRLALRDALFEKLGRGGLSLSGGSELLRRAAARYPAEALVRALDRVTETEIDLKNNANAAMSLQALFVGILEGR